MIPKQNWRTKLSDPLRKPDFTKNPQNLHRIIIETSWLRTDKIASIVDSNHGTVHREIKLIPALVVEYPYALLEELARSRHVRKIWYDSIVYIRLDMAVPTVGGTKAHKAGFSGKGSVIAVIDTGIHPHRDFITPENRIISWQDFVNQKNSPYDDNGHGTHVAGIIAGNGELSNGKYIGMAPESLLVGVKTLDQDGSGTTSNVLSGIEWCLENATKLKIKALNLSMGTTAQDSCYHDPLCRAVGMAWKKGLIVCAAAGNEGPDARTIDTPGINPKIITVGNLDDRETISNIDDRLSKSSSRGPTIDNFVKPNILAPGTDITSTWLNDSYRNLTGTSMATPMVTGTVGLILEKWPHLKPDQVKRILLKNARDLGLSPNLQGAGVLDLSQLFKNSMMSQVNRKDIGEILGFQLMELLFKNLGIQTKLFVDKRNEAIKRVLFQFFS